VESTIYASWEVGDIASMQMAPDQIPASFRIGLWSWFDSHSDDVIVHKKSLVFKVSVTLGQLRPLFVTLFGPHT
jgi:hypothetical protein